MHPFDVDLFTLFLFKISLPMFPNKRQAEDIFMMEVIQKHLSYNHKKFRSTQYLENYGNSGKGDVQ